MMMMPPPAPAPCGPENQGQIMPNPGNYPINYSGYMGNAPYVPKPAEQLIPVANLENTGELKPMTCGVVAPGEQTLFDRFTTYNRGFAGDSFPGQGKPGDPVFVPVQMYAKGSAVTPMYGEYTPQLFEVPYANVQPRESIGINVNPYTGEVAEFFIDAMPPPNTDKSRLAGTYEKANPFLIWKNGGGEDPNMPRLQRTEIAQYMPGSDYGPNPWGDQLYADERRERMTNIVSRDVFNNRNGDYPCEAAFNKELPMGFWGYQNWIRWIPYMPPTQELDLDGWTSIADVPNGVPFANDVPSMLPEMTISKVSLTDIYRTGGAELDIGDFVPSLNNRKPTKRADVDSSITPNVDYEVGNYVILDYNPRATLKMAMEYMYDPHNAALEIGDYIPVQGEDRDLTKRQFYSDVEWQSHVDLGGLGDSVGPGEVFSHEFRNAETYLDGYHPSKELQDGGYQYRWVGQTERDPKTEKAPWMGVANFVQNGGINLDGGLLIRSVREPPKPKDWSCMEASLRTSGAGDGGAFQG